MRLIEWLPIAVFALLLASCGGESGNEAPATPVAETATPELDPVAMSFLPAAIRAFGTEPFWSTNITPGKLTYTTPETLAAGGVTVPVVRADGAESVLFTSVLDGQVLKILVTPGACSDGMSDSVYPWTVERSLDEETVQGCAEEPPAPPASDASAAGATQ